MEAIVIDLDGPLLEGRDRHYRVYSEILSGWGYDRLPIEKYWELKREGPGALLLLEQTGAGRLVAEFSEAWLEMIELPEMLSLDKLQPGVPEKLNHWRERGFRLIIATQRQDRTNLYRQLRDLSLDSYFDRVVLCETGGTGRAKATTCLREASEFNPVAWIGDTGVDIEAARVCGCPCWAVTCGLRSHGYLARRGPDFLCDNLAAVDLECVGRASIE